LNDESQLAVRARPTLEETTVPLRGSKAERAPRHRASRHALGQYREVVIVLTAAAVGLTARGALSWLVNHEGINVLLAILVFATATAMDPRSLRELPQLWRRGGLALLAGVTLLPALSLLASRLVASGALRDGVMTTGLAPCEIASIATTAIAGGNVAAAGGVLLGSTLLTVTLGGPILALEAHHSSVHPGAIIANLLLVVALPFALALGLRFRSTLSARQETGAATTSTLAVAGLVALIASEVHLTLDYFGIAGALLAFLMASIILGVLLGRGAGAPTSNALLLTTSMRDFAIAAGLASAAFGPRSAAPLGLYGIMVLTWGMGCAGYLRAKSNRPTPPAPA
jgi:predicted Na+-dependent transporter